MEVSRSLADVMTSWWWLVALLIPAELLVLEIGIRRGWWSS